jgi:type I restriction enzyme S subunit
MASEWRKVSLGDLVDFLSGGTPSKENTNYWNGSLPWVSAKDMKRLFLDDTEDHVTQEGLSNGTTLVPANTVLMLTRGMTLLNDVPICIARRPMTFNQDVKALRPKGRVKVEFLPYLLLGNKHRLLSLVDLAGHGTGRLNTDELKSLDVLLPPEGQQRAIAHILGTLDNKIELNRRMSETLEAIARTLFNSWFVDFDPVRAKAQGREPYLPKYLADLFPDSFEDSGLGEIPKGWEVRGLDEVARFLNGLALQKYPPTDGRSLPVIKISQLRAGKTDGADTASADLEADYIVDDGDVLFSWSGSLECVLWAGGPGALNQHLFKVTSSVYPQWLYYLWIQHHLADFRHTAAAKATTMGHIQRHHLSQAKIVLPSPALLDAATLHIGPLIAASPSRLIEARSLAAVRDALLPKLMSGELPIANVDRILGRTS